MPQTDHGTTGPTPAAADYEQAYDAHTFETVQAEFRKRMLLELFRRLRPRTVLEVGCGLDTFANHWRDAERFVVVEPRAGFAATARSHTAGRPDVQVVEAMLEDAADGLVPGFDLIVLSGLLNEIADCRPLLNAVAGLCGPATTVHVNVPNARSLHRLLAVRMGLIASVSEMSDAQKAFQQPWIFTMESLVALVESCGFRVRESGSYFVKPFTHAQMQALLDGGFLTPQMLEGFWNLAQDLPQNGSEIFANLELARLADAG
jgi:hypothetical protein